ncbi:hypothetical protein C0995_005628 [Termitomyces sp. Mi166|nr:hypothetical protein C0995_005628 [Termitomyces sp. Mi166\
MSNAQKPEGRLVRRFHNFIDRLTPGSRAPSPVPSQGNNVHDAGSQRTEAIAVGASRLHNFMDRLTPGSRARSPVSSQGNNVHDAGLQRTEPIAASASYASLVSATGNPSHGEVNIAANHPSIVIGTATDQVPEVAQDTGGQPVDRDHFAPDHVSVTTKDTLRTTWHGVELVLKKVEGLLAGTPLKTPIGAVNVLIDLTNAVIDNKDALKELIHQTANRLRAVNSALVDLGEEDTEFRQIIEEFSQLLIKKVLEIRAMSEKVTWKKLLDNEEDKAKIGEIFKNTKNFLIHVNFNLKKDTCFSHESLGFEDIRSRGHIIPTLVYQLAHNSKSFAQSLFSIDKLDSAKKLGKQIKDLLVNPWQHFVNKQSKDLPPYLVIIDALDEIQDGGGSEFLKELLQTVENGALNGLKFLVTSRPDPKIVDLCKSFSSDAICHLYNVSADEVNADILKYLKDKLPALRDDPGLSMIVQQAGGLFIYASTASDSL